MARQDLSRRMRQLGNGQEPFCPAIYRVWARGVDSYRVAAEFDASKF